MVLILDEFYCQENLSVRSLVHFIKYKIKWKREHPDYFTPDGLVIFVGPQGSGKTLSAVNYVYRLLQAYASSKLVTNVELRDYPVVTFRDWILQNKINDVDDDAVMENLYRQYMRENRVFPFVDNDDFQRYGNGECGVIFFVDEIQLYLNSLESKNINIDVVTQISQQRKQRKHIVATSQVFGRMAKPLREQFSAVMLCKKHFGCIQNNALLDRDSLDSDDSTGTNLSGKVKKRFLWIHDPDMYGRYDTSSVVERGKFRAGEDRLEIMEVDNGLSASS